MGIRSEYSSRSTTLACFIWLAVLMSNSACMNVKKSIREPQNRVIFNSDDYVFSERISGEAREVKVLGVDWSRLFLRQTGTLKEDKEGIWFYLSQIPIVGGVFSKKKRPESYALYDLMRKNAGYDVVFFPQFEHNSINVLGIVKITDVKVSARLARIDEFE